MRPAAEKLPPNWSSISVHSRWKQMEGKRPRGSNPRGRSFLLQRLWRIPTRPVGSGRRPKKRPKSRFEKQAGAGEARFGFLKFGDVQRRDAEAVRFDAGARVWKRSGEN